MPEENNNGAAQPQIPVAMQLGKPGDQFVVCMISAGTQDLQILTDGKKTESEYCLMLLAAMNAMLLKINGQSNKEKSRILDPFAGLRSRG